MVRRESGERNRKRERTRVTIVAGRGHDTGSEKKKEKRKRSVKEGSVQSRLHGIDGPGNDDCP